MHLSFIFFLASSSLVLARNLPKNSLHTNRNIIGSPGWSLQAETCAVGSTSCGSIAPGACCPSNMVCAKPANSEVAACCTNASECRSVIEAAPKCADDSWNLWAGLDGNDFCCEVGLLGAYDHISHRAGTCVSSVVVPTTSAVLRSTGTGSVVTSIPTAVSSAHITSTIVRATSSFTSDITSRTSLNAVATSKSPSSTVVANSNAAATEKPVFSFDMTGFTSPSQFIPILKIYVTNSAYYYYSGQPFVSTFNGGASNFKFGQDTVNDGWKNELQAVMSASGHPIYFIPSFQDVAASSSFFTTEYPTLNGTFNWNSWPSYTAGDVPVNTIDDVTYQNAAKAAGKGFMMGISPLQFKHIDKTQNWYRRGEANLENRFDQILTLQPDFIEFQTWNDAGESHYMGNSWPEPLVSNSTPEALSSIAYDHRGYWQILQSFISVWKSGARSTMSMVPMNGKDAQGTFWHHTLLKGGDCAGDTLGLGKPVGMDGVEDSVTAVVLVARGVRGLRGSIRVGGKVLGTKDLSAGFNTMVVNNISTGSVEMSVLDAGGVVVVSGKGPLDVVDKADLCNYNFQVVGLS
ncbi:hypothetical protein SS1G_05784 [Sclerotinia sclerotiorum 1980 UF-70]|uniref:Glycoside hydrolase family 71 protein n=1 Tax=Sclerotinia sclerotiorum (strain ATCC 18683 / 1980 / Ss-1) TaxID=665079 RepID=A7EKD7_SCLS1|nr:hypothetical protein SS1G_05784 [Sclerotinia sclerotiorum 1980 UF-70]EDO03303.1 hypothetical protein SS1G_05784 [Sclerotinia sclerotiorum 1980 UF-70]